MTETPAIYGATPQSDFESQYRRILEAAGCGTQAELAALLEIKRSSISDARRRKAVPSEWLVKLFEKVLINPDWIRHGAGPKYLNPADTGQNPPHIVRITEIRPPQECSAQDLFNELVRRALQAPHLAAIQKTESGGGRQAAEKKDGS